MVSLASLDGRGLFWSCSWFKLNKLGLQQEQGMSMKIAKNILNESEIFKFEHLCYWVFLICIFPHSDWIWKFTYFPAFGLNTEIYSVNLHIQSECGKIRTRKTPNTVPFHRGKLLYKTWSHPANVDRFIFRTVSNIYDEAFLDNG